MQSGYSSSTFRLTVYKKGSVIPTLEQPSEEKINGQSERCEESRSSITVFEKISSAPFRRLAIRNGFRKGITLSPIPVFSNNHLLFKNDMDIRDFPSLISIPFSIPFHPDLNLLKFKIHVLRVSGLSLPLFQHSPK